MCVSLILLLVSHSTPSLCSTSTQVACEAGDLTGKHGTLLIPKTAGRKIRAVYTDTNLPLHTLPGLDSIFGWGRNGYLYITPAARTISSAVCARSNGALILNGPHTNPTPTRIAPRTPLLDRSICSIRRC